MPVNFNGQTFFVPQVVSALDDSPPVAVGTSGSGLPALVGTSRGGQPKTPLYFTSYQQVVAALVSGDLVTAARLAFGPSQDGTAGAQQICCVRVNPATPATKNLLKASTAVIALASTAYGAYANTLSVILQAATVAGRKISIQDSRTGLSTVPVDNVQDTGLTIQYTGAGSAATMTVTATTLATTVTGASGDSQSIDLTAYPTVGAVCAFLNATGVYVATPRSLNPARLVADLDQVSAVDIKTAPVQLVGIMIGVIDWLNQNVGSLLTASRASQTVTGAPDLGTFFLAGGSDGATPSATDWQNGFDALKTEDVDLVVALAGDSTTYSMAVAHAQAMSATTEKRERIAIVGGLLGLDVPTAATAAKAINSDRAVYCYPGIKVVDQTNTLVTLPPYMTAALIAGYIAGLDVGESVTYKNANVVGLERNLIQADLNTLLTAGVLPLSFAQGGVYRIVQGRLSYTGDGRFTRTQITTKRAADYCIRTIRDQLAQLIGKRNTPGIVQTAAGITTSALNGLARQNVIVGDSTNTAYKDVTATLNGDVITVDFTANFVVPIDYITLTAHATTFTSST